MPQSEQEEVTEAGSSMEGLNASPTFARRGGVPHLRGTTDQGNLLGTGQYEPKVPYPQNSLAERLKLAAQLIDAEVGARVYYVEQENYDTHANQASTHAQLLGDLSSALTAFYQDLKARGHGKRVLGHLIFV